MCDAFSQADAKIFSIMKTTKSFGQDVFRSKNVPVAHSSSWESDVIGWNVLIPALERVADSSLSTNQSCLANLFSLSKSTFPAT